MTRPLVWLQYRGNTPHWALHALACALKWLGFNVWLYPRDSRRWLP